jgi:predicted GNAT family acetyltransferase
MTEDPAEGLAAAGDFLAAQPIENSIALTILHDRIADPEPGRYWWVEEAGTTTGYVFQSPTTFMAGLTPCKGRPLSELAEAVAADAPDLPGVVGEAATAAAFAGHWAELLKTPAQPVEGGRIYRLGPVRAVERPPGTARRGLVEERELYLSWADGFLADTDSQFPIARLVDRHLASGRLWVWDDGGPVSMASISGPVAGVARVGHVYTPPERRGKGYAAACVVHVSQATMEAGADECILHTQLANPTSNAIYRRIGYEPVSEVLFYRFG